MGSRGWLRNLNQVLRKLHLPHSSQKVLYDMDAVEAACMHVSKQKRWDDAERKSKLCSYVEFKDRSDPTTLVSSNLKRYNRSLLAKLLCGILPLEVETGRYIDVKKEFRFCTVCKTRKVEDEYHFLFSCRALQEERSAYYLENIDDFAEFILLPDYEKVKLMLSKTFIKSTSKFVEAIFRKRRTILYGVN